MEVLKKTKEKHQIVVTEAMIDELTSVVEGELYLLTGENPNLRELVARAVVSKLLSFPFSALESSPEV